MKIFAQLNTKLNPTTKNNSINIAAKTHGAQSSISSEKITTVNHTNNPNGSKYPTADISINFIQLDLKCCKVSRRIGLRIIFVGLEQELECSDFVGGEAGTVRNCLYVKSFG